MEQCDSKPLTMDRHLDVMQCREDGGLLLGASSLSGRYWLGSLWFYQTPGHAPDVDKCTAGVQLEAGISDACWVDERHVIVALDTGGVALWSLEDECRTFLLSYSAAGHDDIATGVSVACNRGQAVSCGSDRCIKEWDLSNMELLSSYKAHTDRISCVDCHPSESQIFVSCGQDGRLLLWDKRKTKPASLLKTSPLKTLPTCVQWQPSQIHKMAVGSESGQFALLDTRMGVENFLQSSPHSRPIHRLQFSPSQNSLLASVGEDCQTVVSSISDEGITQSYIDGTHTDFVQGVTWCPDSSSSSPHLLTCGWDSKVIRHQIKKGITTIQGDCQASLPIHINGTTTNGETMEKMPNGKGNNHLEGMTQEEICKKTLSQESVTNPSSILLQNGTSEKTSNNSQAMES